uniref:Probable GPI-anchored adhesin-like protein PGA55-like n=1 Tax=Saccoglossus kowalevskii TaxID=10224 RepID=A0ABM0LUS4_SACKO|nr:PREDICTED: probable GPI-anchored adhesin-like protein PGA55-like [Saccoglossus kowalevskii]
MIADLSTDEDDEDEFEDTDELDTTHPELVALIGDLEDDTPPTTNDSSDLTADIKYLQDDIVAINASTPMESEPRPKTYEEAGGQDTLYISDDEDVNSYRLRALSLSPVTVDNYVLTVERETPPIATESEPDQHAGHCSSKLDSKEVKGTSTSPIHTDDHSTDTYDMFSPVSVNDSDILDPMREEYNRMRGIIQKSASPQRKPRFQLPKDDFEESSISKESASPDVDYSLSTSSSDQNREIYPTPCEERTSKIDEQHVRTLSDREVNVHIDRIVNREQHSSVEEDQSGSESADSFTIVFLKEGEAIPSILTRTRNLLKDGVLPRNFSTKTCDTQTYIPTKDESSLTDESSLSKTENELDTMQQHFEEILHTLSGEEDNVDELDRSPTDTYTQTDGSQYEMKDEGVGTDAAMSNLSSTELNAVMQDRDSLLQWLNLNYDRNDLTVQLMEADLMHGIGETDALLKALEDDIPTSGLADALRRRIQARRRTQIEIFLEERENINREINISSSENVNRTSRTRNRASRSVNQLLDQRRTHFQQTGVPDSGVQGGSGSHSDIDKLLREYKDVREQSKREIAKARETLKERTKKEKKKMKDEIDQLRLVEMRRKQFAEKAKEEIRKEKHNILYGERAQSESPARPRSTSPGRRAQSYTDRTRNISPSLSSRSRTPDSRTSSSGQWKPSELRDKFKSKRSQSADRRKSKHNTFSTPCLPQRNSLHRTSSDERLQSHSFENLSSRSWSSTDSLHEYLSPQISPRFPAVSGRWRSSETLARPLSSHTSVESIPRVSGTGRARSMSPQRRHDAFTRRISPNRPANSARDYGRAYELYSPRTGRSPERGHSDINQDGQLQPILDAVEREILHLRETYSQGSHSESEMEFDDSQNFDELCQAMNVQSSVRSQPQQSHTSSSTTASCSPRVRGESPQRRHLSMVSRTSPIQEETNGNGSEAKKPSLSSKILALSKSIGSASGRQPSSTGRSAAPWKKFSQRSSQASSADSEELDLSLFRGRSQVRAALSSTTSTASSSSCRGRSPSRSVRRSTDRMFRLETPTTPSSLYRHEPPERDLSSISITQQAARVTSSPSSVSSTTLETRIVPRPVGSISTDYHCIGNQASQALLSEIILAGRFDPRHPQQPSEAGGWSFQGIERDVVILRKEHTNNPVHSFMGIGIIQAPASSVYNIIRNPSTRYLYDRMLKKLKVIDKVCENVQIVYMLHETAHCFLNQSRDVCIVQHDSVQDGRYVVAATSVQHPSCPSTDSSVRAEVISAGAVIEPITIGNRECCKVFYITQIDLKGDLPMRLLNLIARRQPLCIAYMRSYIEIGGQ